MSAPAGAPARAAYRALLRAVSRHVTSVSGNGLFREALRAEFRAGAAQRDPAAVAAAVARAEDAAFYVAAVNDHKNLLLSYGISIDKEADTRERVKHTAARVGLAVAEFDERGQRTDAPPRTK